jgi:hypothetical protein
LIIILQVTSTVPTGTKGRAGWILLQVCALESREVSRQEIIMITLLSSWKMGLARVQAPEMYYPYFYFSAFGLAKLKLFKNLLVMASLKVTVYISVNSYNETFRISTCMA